jgi:hypothetical protein
MMRQLSKSMGTYLNLKKRSYLTSVRFNTTPASLVKATIHTTLPICSMTPPPVLFMHTTVTQNKYLLALTLYTSSDIPLSSTFAKSTKMHSIGPRTLCVA